MLRTPKYTSPARSLLWPPVRIQLPAWKLPVYVLRPIKCVYPKQNTQFPTPRFVPLVVSLHLSDWLISCSVQTLEFTLISPLSLHAKAAAHLRLGLEPTTSGLGGDLSLISQLKLNTWSQDLMKLIFFMFRCRRNSATGKVIEREIDVLRESHTP